MRLIGLTDSIHVLCPLRASGVKHLEHHAQITATQQHHLQQRAQLPTTIPLPAQQARAQPEKRQHPSDMHPSNQRAVQHGAEEPAGVVGQEAAFMMPEGCLKVGRCGMAGNSVVIYRFKNL